jgi:hypothetical protein
MKLPALIFVALVVTSCASVPELKQQLAASEKITKSFAEMRFQPLRLSEVEVITLDSEQPAFDFLEGRSFYVARAIPNVQTTRMLQVKTYLSTLFLPKANVLVPRFLFLDDSKRSVGLIKTYPLKRGVDFWRGVYFESEVDVPAAASYVVLYTFETEYPKLYSVSANGTERLVPHSPTGTIDAKVMSIEVVR